MPIKPLPERSATPGNTGDAEPGTGAVTAVERSLRLLEAFGLDDAHLSLAELSRRTALHKSTALRLARTLAARDYLVHQADGNWRLGRTVGWLGACYQAAFRVQDVVEPVLRELSATSGESASFYVREGQQRACVARVEGPQSVRHHVRVGAVMPLNLGAPGRVILAFSAQPGEPYEQIRQRGYHVSIGERDVQVASVAAPVFGLMRQVLGSVCISGPVARLDEARLMALAPQLLRASFSLSQSLASERRVESARR